MKTTLIVIQNEADHADAKKLDSVSAFTSPQICWFREAERATE